MMKSKTLLSVVALAVLIASHVSIRVISAEELIFSDDFNDGTLADRWHFSPTGLDVFGGRARGLENGRVMRTIDEFSGDVRVEFDFEKLGGQNHSCWDLGIGFTRSLNVQGVLRFDHNDVDAVRVGTSAGAICSDGELDTVDGDSANSGHVTLTMQDEVLSIEFASDDGNVLQESGPVDVVSPYRLFFSIAAHDQTPRFVDNVQVFSLEEAVELPGDYDGSGAVEQGDLDLVLLNWGADASTTPDGWISNLPSGTVDQDELDGVLLNWGNTGTAAVRLPAATIPEPTAALLFLHLAALVAIHFRIHLSRSSLPR